MPMIYILECKFKGPIRRFISCIRGATAIEFALIIPVFVILLIACIQLSLVFLSELQIRTAIADVASTAPDPNQSSARDPAAIRQTICNSLVMADNCTANLRLEQSDASALSGTYKPITGSQFATGADNQVMVIRAEAPIITIIPGFTPISVSATSIWLKK